jgi:UDP-N-acetylglucosamine acyltransferase
MSISPLAVVDKKAVIADDVEIGPFCVVGPDVTIGPGCRLHNHVTLMGPLVLGSNNVLYPNVVLGGAPQDRKYRGAPTRLEIGNSNILREAVTLHRGTEKGGGITRVGNNNYFMVNTHAGHDAQVGSNCTFANNVMIAGHVVIHDGVTMAGAVGIHHFVTVGELSFLGAFSRIRHDVPPFSKVDGGDVFRGINVVGLRRSGQFTQEDIEALEEACRQLFYRDKPFAVAMAEFDTMNGLNRHVRRMIEFFHRRDLGKHGRYLEGKRGK